MSSPQSTIDLTPRVRRTLASLTAPRYGQRGVNLMMRRPLQDWTRPLDRARVATHLGIQLPRWPVFEERG